jgi:hypothetical protein
MLVKCSCGTARVGSDEALTIILLPSIVLVIIIESNARCANRNDLLSTRGLTHTRELVGVTVECSIAVVRDGHDVAADGGALGWDVVVVNVLGEHWGGRQECEDYGGGRCLHVGRTGEGDQRSGTVCGLSECVWDW